MENYQSIHRFQKTPPSNVDVSRRNLLASVPSASFVLLHVIRSLAALLGCLHAAAAISGYTFTAIPYGGGPFAWIGNDSVLFTGAPTGEPLQSSRQLALYSWNTRTREVTELMQIGARPDLCYDRGYLYVSFDRGEYRVVRQGPIGREKEIVIKRGESSLKGHFNRYNCRFQQTPSPSAPERRVVSVLRDDHGFIESERTSEPNKKQKLSLIRPSGERIPLDLRCGAGGPRFSEYRQAYVYQDGGSFSGRDVERLTCLILTNGTTTNHVLPKGDWLRGTVYGMPVRDAILMISLSTVAKADGVYIIRGRDVELAIRGYVNSFAVSPNGCAVALYLDRKGEANPSNGVMNVCEGER